MQLYSNSALSLRTLRSRLLVNCFIGFSWQATSIDRLGWVVLYLYPTRPDPTRSVEVGWLPPEGAGGAFQGREERGVLLLERVGVASRRVSVLPRGLLSRESASDSRSSDSSDSSSSDSSDSSSNCSSAC